MRAVLQRVLSASVEVDGVLVSQIGPGLLCLVGICDGDSDPEAGAYICRKILKSRLWPSESGKGWDRSVVDIQGEVLMVSQFTLFGRLNGNRLDFSQAAKPQQAEALYDALFKQVGREYATEKVKDGKFGAMMNVSLVNDGPVTIVIDSSSR